jgi:hypothetical protein
MGILSRKADGLTAAVHLESLIRFDEVATGSGALRRVSGQPHMTLLNSLFNSILKNPAPNNDGNLLVGQGFSPWDPSAIVNRLLTCSVIHGAMVERVLHSLLITALLSVC